MRTRTMPAVIAVLGLCATLQPAAAGTVNVVLVGATGNLAGKYLWQAMYNIHLENSKLATPHTLNFVGAGRAAADKGEPQIRELIANKVDCIPGTSVAEVCSAETKVAFESTVSYGQLKTREHYADMCAQFRQAPGDEEGRIIYLSVPPFAYAEVAGWIGEVCTDFSPKNKVRNPFVRVAFEKPFGSDLASAEKMAGQLSAVLKEEQIYRVDHYLGKMGVKMIGDFRKANEASFRWMWDDKGIEKVEIVMMESEDCAGRAGYYDEYGVIRDVHQNHLTEILSLITHAEYFLPEQDSPDKVLVRKANILDLFAQANKSNTLIGQYEGYAEHVQTDKKDATASTNAPTMAIAELTCTDPRWEKTKFMILAGKQLHRREAYVRFQFNEQIVGNYSDDPSDHQLLFHIQGGEPKRGPRLVIGGAMPEVYPANDLWTETTGTDKDKPDWAIQSFDIGAGVPDRPYDKLLWAMFNGDQADFVGTRGLLSAWQLWDKVLAETADVAPMKYPGGMDPSFLYNRTAPCSDHHDGPLCPALSDWYVTPPPEPYRTKAWRKKHQKWDTLSADRMAKESYAKYQKLKKEMEQKDEL